MPLKKYLLQSPNHPESEVLASSKIIRLIPSHINLFQRLKFATYSLCFSHDLAAVRETAPAQYDGTAPRRNSGASRTRPQGAAPRD
jgi:hypothetical protein